MSEQSQSGDWYDPRTDPPNTRYGEALDRFSARVGDADPTLPDHAVSKATLICPECSGGHIDRWINEGATNYRHVCVDCGHTWGGRDAPERSEPADFGGGESTGVQDL